MESFLLAADARARDASAPKSAATQAVTAFTFDLKGADSDEHWSDIWINAFDGYGSMCASLLPPPPPQEEWHPCSYRNNADIAFRAVEEENLPRVRELFTAPKDLLRWRMNQFTCGHVVSFEYHESILHAAFATLNLEILQHLYTVSPLRFMQLMGMTNTEEHMGEGATLPLLYSISLAFRDTTGERCSRESQEARRELRLPAIMSWLCDTGLMTPTLAAICFPVTERRPPKRVKQETMSRWIIEAEYARDYTPTAALSVLEHWEQLGMEQQMALSLEVLENIQMKMSEEMTAAVAAAMMQAVTMQEAAA